jgi:hypothetical protein
VSSIDPNVLAGTGGYLVADVRGRIVGKVERAAPNPRDGAGSRLTIRGRFPWRRRRLVLASEIDAVDAASRVIALKVERRALRAAP